MSDIDTVVVDSLKALDPKRPIREADMRADIASCLLRASSRHCCGDRLLRPSWQDGAWGLHQEGLEARWRSIDAAISARETIRLAAIVPSASSWTGMRKFSPPRFEISRK